MLTFIKNVSMLGAAIGGVVVVAAACDSNSGASGCSEARRHAEADMHTICDSAGYKGVSAFCAKCADAQFYSYAAQQSGKCLCRPLTFDEVSCSYLEGEDALEQTRGAIDFADRACVEFQRPSMEDGGAPPADSAAGDAGTP
jgi:hypothetical protein